MAFLQQKASATSLLATVSATFATTPQPGNLLVAAVTANVGTGSIAISGWTAGKTANVGVAGGLVVFYKVAGAAESTTVTSTATLAAFMDIHIFEYDGIDDASPLDQTGTTADGGSGVTSRSSGTSGTTVDANELIFVAVATAGDNGGGVSWTNSVTAETTTTDLMTGDKSVTATGTYESTASWTNSVRAAGVVLTFLGETGDSYGLKIPLKPRIPVINWNNPLTKKLRFVAPLFERATGICVDLVSKNYSTLPNGTANWVTGMYGTEFKFDGATRLGWGSGVILNSNVFSLLTLIKPTSVTGLQTMLGTTSSSGIQFRMNGANLEVLKATVASVATSTGTISANVYSLVGFTYDAAGNYVFYNNGLPIGSGTNAQTFDLTGQPQLGERVRSANAEWFTGNMVFFYAWNRVLTIQEMNLLYQNPFRIYSQPGILM